MKYIEVEDHLIFVDKISFIKDVSKDNYYKRWGIKSRIYVGEDVLDVTMDKKDIQFLIDLEIK